MQDTNKNSLHFQNQRQQLEQFREKNINLKAQFWKEAIKLQAQLNSAKKVLNINEYKEYTER